MRKRVQSKDVRLTLENVEDLVCEFLQDGERRDKRDVGDWLEWMQKKFSTWRYYRAVRVQAAKDFNKGGSNADHSKESEV